MDSVYQTVTRNMAHHGTTVSSNYYYNLPNIYYTKVSLAQENLARRLSHAVLHPSNHMPPLSAAHHFIRNTEGGLRGSVRSNYSSSPRTPLPQVVISNLVDNSTSFSQLYPLPPQPATGGILPRPPSSGRLNRRRISNMALHNYVRIRSIVLFSVLNKLIPIPKCSTTAMTT